MNLITKNDLKLISSIEFCVLLNLKFIAARKSGYGASAAHAIGVWREPVAHVDHIAEGEAVVGCDATHYWQTTYHAAIWCQHQAHYIIDGFLILHFCFCFNRRIFKVFYRYLRCLRVDTDVFAKGDGAFELVSGERLDRSGNWSDYCDY